LSAETGNQTGGGSGLINGLEIELTRLVKSPLPLFAKEGESLPLEKGGEEGFSESVMTIMKPLITGQAA
jgi:hypothetical protein